MNVDDIVKLLLAISVAFAIIGISYALIRFILKLTDTVEDVRKPIQNIGQLSDLALEDYKSIRGVIATVAKISKGLNTLFEDRLKIIQNITEKLKRSK